MGLWRKLKDKIGAAVARNALLRPPRLIAVIVGAGVLVGLIFAGYYFEGSGFGAYTNPSGVVERGKTFWDWLELLIIPATLAAGGLWFSSARTKEEREIAEERTQETALQTYLDQMSKLLIDKALASDPKPETKDVARIWTLTIVRRVNGERKGIVVRFLHESNLIQGSNPIVSLEDADLTGAALGMAKLMGVTLHRGEPLGGETRIGGPHRCVPSGANLFGVDLCAAKLSRANLSRAILAEADLTGADLSGANLTGAHLFCGAILAGRHSQG